MELSCEGRRLEVGPPLSTGRDKGDGLHQKPFRTPGRRAAQGMTRLLEAHPTSSESMRKCWTKGKTAPAGL
ncbi:Matrin-3 [Manis pentadactyla]|nr:Matrin-3 [Manis pentadactyla]